METFHEFCKQNLTLFICFKHYVKISQLFHKFCRHFTLPTPTGGWQRKADNWKFLSIYMRGSSENIIVVSSKTKPPEFFSFRRHKYTVSSLMGRIRILDLKKKFTDRDPDRTLIQIWIQAKKIPYVSGSRQKNIHCQENLRNFN